MATSPEASSGPGPARAVGCEVIGRGGGPRIVAIHGFTQNRHCWGPIARDLAEDHEVVLVDAPGHGASSAIATDLRGGAALIAEAAGAGTYLGYSMGGRYALQLGLDHPDVVERLVLIGASPGIVSPDERAARRRADDDLADHLEAIGLEAFLAEWLAQPLFRGLSAEARCLPERLENTAAGLASSLRTAGTGAQEPVWDRLSQLRMPVLLVVGGDDAKFTAIAERMAAVIGDNASVVSIPGAGHTAHLEAPAAFLAALRAWLAAHPVGAA